MERSNVEAYYNEDGDARNTSGWFCSGSVILSTSVSVLTCHRHFRPALLVPVCYFGHSGQRNAAVYVRTLLFESTINCRYIDLAEYTTTAPHFTSLH
jgi:hypothetical protein